MSVDVTKQPLMQCGLDHLAEAPLHPLEISVRQSPEDQALVVTYRERGSPAFKIGVVPFEAVRSTLTVLRGSTGRPGPLKANWNPLRLATVNVCFACQAMLLQGAEDVVAVILLRARLLALLDEWRDQEPT